MERLSEIRARCEAATPGPWYWDAIDAHKRICLESARWKVMDFARYGMYGAAPRFLVDGIMERADSLLKSIPGKEHHRGFDNYIDHPDAAFIAHAREDIPYLLAELEQSSLKINALECANHRAYDDGFNDCKKADDRLIANQRREMAELTARAEKAEAERDTVVDDFQDFVTSGIHNMNPYCANRRQECTDCRGYCIENHCSGFRVTLPEPPEENEV